MVPPCIWIGTEIFGAQGHPARSSEVHGRASRSMARLVGSRMRDTRTFSITRPFCRAHQTPADLFPDTRWKATTNNTIESSHRIATGSANSPRTHHDDAIQRLGFIGQRSSRISCARTSPQAPSAAPRAVATATDVQGPPHACGSTKECYNVTIIIGIAHRSKVMTGGADFQLVSGR